MNSARSGRAISRNRCFLPACRYEAAFPASCNERAPVQCDCGPVAMNLGRVATIMGRTVPASCNQCGPAGAMIAGPSTDVCGPLQLPQPSQLVTAVSSKAADATAPGYPNLII